MASDTFTYDGQTFTLTERLQLLNAKGSMWTDGHKTFVRGYDVDEDFDHNESAGGMLQRINRDAGLEIIVCALNLLPRPYKL